MNVAVRQRRSTGELALPFGVFRQADYGQVCQLLGLRPSRPHTNAAGIDTRKRRRKRR